MISINNLSVHFTGDYLFNEVSFIINDRDRIGLVGKNGAGKTTLLRIIAGEVEPEKGDLVKTSGQTIGYLPQEMSPGSTRSILEESMMAFRELVELEQKVTRLTEEIAIRQDYDSEEYLNLIHKLTDANDRIHLLGGNSIHEQCEKILTGLGFERKDFIRSLNEFSSGWQMRVELAKILLSKPGCILLDEPTNHLDIESIQWLEEYLAVYPGSVVLVSHDRAFLDAVTNRTIEISMGKIYDYPASYSDYVEMRAQRMESEVASYNNQQRQIAQIERFIERFRYKATKARQVQSRVKQLEKIEKVEIEDIDNSSIHFKFPPAPHSGKIVVESHHLTKSYGHHQVLNDLNFFISKGEKIAFVGRNGEGKTTLSKVIAGKLEYHGELKIGHMVIMGYYAQNQHEMLDGNKTVFETVDEVAVGDMRPKLRGLLGSFLFSGDSIDKKVKVLSGGEKSRLSLARLLLTPANLLILDEPTNHLDMRSKDILKNALLQYEGTLILVSHDRDFLAGLTDRVFEFRKKNIREYTGDVYDFLEYRKLESLKQLEVMQTSLQNQGKDEPSVAKVQWEKKKDSERELRRIANQIKKSEDQIEFLEQQIRKRDELLLNPETYKDFMASKEKYQEYEQLKNDLEKEMLNWEKLNEELEKMKAE